MSIIFTFYNVNLQNATLTTKLNLINPSTLTSFPINGTSPNFTENVLMIGTLGVV